ncbi:hypothetical protein [Shewanella sp. MBTL60-007]|uniref:hypothetical protein n=1 Tax=Shewanella sp. MBTL60-007 TaxID=2815911 RepID=UPI001C827BA3|nr:hypothetical protein [Shewanella sp. MBTL60-007]
MCNQAALDEERGLATYLAEPEPSLMMVLRHFHFRITATSMGNGILCEASIPPRLSPN